MNENDNIQYLYDNLKKNKYLTEGSIDDFRAYLEDEGNRQSLYDNLKKKNFLTEGSVDDFNAWLGVGQQPAQRVDVSDVEAQQQPNIPTVTMEQVDNEPQQPYGDLTAENFVTMQQRGKELADQRKRIQRELDNDTEMEPLTASQRKEYESQLRGLDEEMRGVSSWIDEWNKTEGARAYYEQQKRAVDDVSARIDQMQADRNRERISKSVEEDNKKSWWQRMAEGLASAENPITEEVVEAITDTNNNDLRAARNEVRNAKNQLRLEEMRQNGEQRGLGFLRGMENANYYELMPAVGMADAMSILQLSKDIKDGKELTDSQKLLKEAMEARAGVDFAYQDNNTLWERIGQSTPEQLMFTLQFVVGAGVTGATKVGEKVAAKSAEKAAKRLAKKEATSAARNFVATRVVPELEGMAVSSAIQTFANPLNVAGMVEDFEKRYAGDIYYDKDGNLHVFDNDRSTGQAAYQAIASAWIENFTEYAGGNITKSAKLLDSKMFDLAGKFDNVMKTVGAGKIQDVFRIPQQLGRLTQIGSAPEEFLEEELGSVMNALMATDAQRGESYGEAFKNTISSSFAGEQQLETFLSCAITSMLLGGGGNAVNGVRNAGLRKSVNQDVEQSKALLGKVRGIDIEGLDNMIENGRVSDISAYLKEQSDANNWNKDEQGAAVSYVLNRSRQIGVKHNDDTAIEAEQAEYRRQAEDMVNRWDGQNIYNVNYTDRNGETQEGTIVNGRVHYNTNEDGTYTFDPYMSSGMLAIRRADGSVEQVAGRNVTALNNVATIEEQLESQNQTISQMMRAEFDQDGMLPTIESVWGVNLVPNVTQFQNGRYTYLRQDDNGLYAFANNDKKTSKDNPIVYLTERQLIEYGLSLNLENAQANGDTEAAQKAQDDIDFLKRLDEITADAGAKGQWDVVKAYAQKNVQLDANGDIIPDGSNEQATAAYLLAISEGSFENAIASVDQTIAALGTPQQTEVTDNAADNAAMNNAAATVDADKARQIDFYTNVRNRLTEMQQGKEEADQEEAEQVVANTPVSQMEVGKQFPVEWRGQQAMATVMGKDADGRSVVTVRDMNGEDIEAGIDDMSDAQWEAVRVQPQQPEPPMESAGNGTEQVQPEPAPTPEPTPQPQPTPTPAQPTPTPVQTEPAPIPTTSDVQPSMEIPRDKEGKAEYDKITDPYVYAAAVTEEFGDEAIDVVNALIESEEAALEGAKKIKDTIKRFREQRESKARLDLFNKVKDILAPQEQTETPTEETTPVEEVPTEQPTAETPVEEAPAEEAPAETPMESAGEGTEQTGTEQAPEQPAESVPDWTEDTAKAARERGYRMVDGERVDRQEPIEGVEGNEVEVKFSDTEKPEGKWKVVEAESLQPSHRNKRRNPSFFITEAQPKERKDNASDEASTKIAKDINPEEVMQGVTAYSGSPVINSRGEVIQGNNRTIGLQKMYESYPESQEKYKQALMDKAEQMGLDKEAIGKMQHPVLVRSVDVDDDTAIKLGQKTSQDTESGGKQRMGASQVRNGLGDKYANLIEMLFADTTEDEGIGEAIARNGVTALKYLWNQKVINNTQYQSALENGDLTAEAKEDFRNIIMESLFDGGPDGLRTAFNMLPAKSQNAILQTIYRDAKSNDESKIKGEVQQAIMAFANLMGFKSFAAAKNQTDVENAVNSWLGQQNMFSDVANTEKYTNFALELAKRFKWQTLTGQRAFFNELYDKLQGVASEGLSMFEEVQQLGLAEAIKAVYGIDYLKPQQNNGISGSNVVADDNGTRQEGEQGGTAETESGERAESGERPADDRGGDERTDREGQKTESGETVEEASEVAPEDIETASANPAATETKVEKGLTEEDVDAAEGIDTQTKLLAKEYIKGNKNELTKDAYEEVREYYAERGRRNSEQDGETASGTQLASADNETADQRSGGQRGVESGRVDRGGSEETLSENGRRGEDSEEQPSATAGEQSVDSGNGEQLGSVGQPADSGDTTGSGRSGGNGSNVRQPRGEKEGSRVSGTGTRGQSGTSQRRSTDEIDKDIADDLAEISSLFKEFVADQKKMGIAANPEEQAKEDIAWFRNVRKAIFKLAGHVFERGYTQFYEWKNKIKDLLHSAIKNFRDKLSDERLDQLLADAWECPFEYNGEVKTIREWASDLHAAEVRKMLSKSIEEKRKEQEEANKRHIKQVHGDLNNIKETLPFLLPHQQENVAKAERQFFSEEHADREHGFGKGYCFTDGTGTGKTFTGLGIARRFVNEGKGRILILTTKTKVNDWVADGAKMGLDVTSLEAGAKKAGKTPTEFKGSGIVCTTYANARQNKALLEDVFDLVIYDESHYIMNNKGGEETISTKSHYMLTNKNIENALARLQEIHPLWIKEQELVEERQAQEAIISNDEASYATQQAAVARISQIDGQLKQIKEQQKDELPAMREKAAEAAKITKAVFLSATPFKSIDNLEYAEGYLFSYPEEDALTKGSTDHRSGKDEFKLRFFGSMYRWRHHQIEEHVQNLDAAVQQQQAFADRLMETLGTMSGQVLDNGYDYSRHFPLVEVAMADQFNSAVEAINRDPALRVLGEYFPFDDYQKMSVLFETMKVAAMLPRIREHLEKGRKVVIFNRRTNYPQPTAAHPNPWVPQNPFTEGLATAIATAKQSDPNKADVIMNAVNLFQERYNSLIAWADKLDYRLPAEQLKDAFGDKIEIINGKVTGKKRQAIIDKFNRDDDQGLDLLLGQEITMREGISIHDTTGNKQRVVMSLALPQETTTFIQGEGRIYRIGNKSNAIFEYPLLGINRELQLFALSFNAAVGVTENLAMGSSARNLARSIAKGVIEDSGVVPLDNQGVGGREKDYGKSTRDAYSSAINDYYSNQKQKAGRENRLGQDYYATPEPLGFKMVQWLNLAEGEEVLEPSAGHGAIARYFPNNVRSLAIEPSDALFTMLALNTGGVDKDNAAQASGKNKFVQNGTFEDLKTINKYDAIAMNPPFGHAGATAIEHLEKAWQHLRNSGRIAIIVPTGAMDKKMEKWFDEHKNAVVVGEIKLPSVTFQQAGTSVSTRMLLIDRVDRASFRQKVAAKRVMLDMTGVQNIDEFFRELRDVDMPSRMIDPATKLLRHGDALRNKLVSNDIVDYKRNPQTDRRSKNMGKDMTVGEEGVSMYLSNKAKGMNYDFYYSQRASWNDIKKLRDREGTFFNARGYVYLSDLANCETLAEAKDKRLMDKWNSTQENFEQAKEFAEAMTDFIRRVTGFTDEQIRDYAAGKVDLFDYTKIKDNAQLTFQDLTRRYEDMEQDPMLQALFEQVSTIAERLGMKIETFNDPYTTVMGSYNPLTNTLRINSGRWNNPSESDSAKSQTILHELIHSVTLYALNAYDKGLPMSEGLKEACRRTYEIFENIKGDYPSYYGNSQVFAPSDAPKEARYGFANTHEMLAEMANPTFRKYLQKKGLWKKLVDGIKRILNYLGLQNLGMRFTQNMDSEQYRRWYGADKENVETATNAGWVATNAFDELSETLDMFLDNFDAALYERRNDGIVRSNIVDREGTKEEGIEYSIRELPAPKKTGIGYKVFVLKDGQLYPPMVANPNGASTPVGYWLDADAAPVVGESKTGRAQVKAGGKGTQGGSGQLAYRPGWHLGEIPYALQFNRKDENGEKTLFPKDFVWAEVEYADDVNYQEEAESYGMTENGKYRHSYAGLPRVPENGSYRYRTNPNPETDPWIITGAMRVNRILTPSEVDAMVREAGREPQQRQEGAVTDEQVNALNEALGLNEDLYRDQEREYEFGETLPIKKDADGRYRVEGLNDSYTNLDRLLDAWRDEHLDYFAEIRNGKLYVEPWNLPEPKTAKEKRYLKKSRERAWRNMHTRADDTIKKLGLQDRVTILDSTDGLEGKKKTAKGWFDPATGKIVIVMPNHRDPHDVMKTILHEGVAHYGLRQLVGNDNMNEFLDKVFEHASKDVRDRIIDLAMNKYNRNVRKATEEYLAGLAESTNFEDAKDKDWFKKIKAWFMQMLHKVGIDFGNFGEAVDNATFWGDRFTDNELRYLLWKSYRNLVADAESRAEIARDAVMQSELEVGNYAPAVAAESMAREDGTYGTNMADISGVISDKGEINNERLNEVIKSVQEGRAKVSRIPSGLGEAHETVPAIAAQAIAKGYAEAELVSQRNNTAERKGADGRNERGTGRGVEEGVPASGQQDISRLIKQWAKDNGYWFDESRIKEFGDEIKGGSESRVFRSKDGQTIVKSTGPYNYDGYNQLVIESMEMFGKVFPNTPYTIIGFAEDTDGNLCVVASQPYVQGVSIKEYAEQQGWVIEDEITIGLDTARMNEYLENKISEQYGLNVSGGFGNYENLYYMVTDLHRGNVIVDANGDVSVIDANISLNTDDKFVDYLNDDILFRDAEPANKIADQYNRETGANVSGVNNVKRGWEQFARGMFDDMRPLEQMQNAIAKALGRELRDSEKAYELATQLVSKTGRQIDRENLDYMVPMLQQVTTAMRSLMEAEGLSREEAYKRVNNYLLAKHGLERNEWFIKQGKKDGDYGGLRGLAENLGENPDDYKAVAERIVNEFEQEVDTKDLWKSMKALTDRMLEISYETGMIDKDTFEGLKQRYKNYVPLRGFAEGTASDLFDYVSQSPHYQNIMKTAKGRKSMADDPLGNLMNMLQSAIVIGNQNQVMQKIYNLAVNGKSDLLRISKPWYVYNDTTDTWEEKFPDIPEDASADEIDAIMKKFDADMQQLKAQGKAKQKRNRLEVGKKILPAEAREHRMIAYINGQKVAMHVAGNPLVAQAMNRRNTQHLGKVMQGIQTATRWYSSINTSWSPAFGPKNARRDIRFMLFSSFVEGGMKKQLSALGNILRATWVLPRLIVTGKMDSGITKMLNKQDAAQLEQWWNEFLDNGGETGFTRTLNAEKAKAEVKDMVRHMLNGSKDGENRVRKYTLGLLEEFGRYSEDISRFAAYCMQRAKGDTVLGSINEAKNVTVNFNVHGGSDLAANMRALYSFFNASMQGINRMRRLATEHPKRFLSGIATLMLGGAVLPWLNMAMFAMLGGDDDDWRKYEELTEYTANHNMILYVGNHKFLSIPWSQELAPFNALGNIWFRQQMGWNKGKSVAEQWGDMLVDLSPVSVTSGKKPGVGLVKTIMPSFTTPVWEAIFNEDFTGSPLYKDNQWNKYDAAWEKAYEGKTSKSVIDASRWLDEKTGIDINPAIAEHLFSGVLGGMGRSGDKLLRYFTNGFQLQDAPFIRTMMFDSNPKGYIGAVQREYGRLAYDVLPKAKHDAEDMTATEFAAFTQTEEYDIANTVSIYKTGKDLAGNKTSFQGIDKMEKEYKKVAGMSDGSEEYREQLEELRLQITEYKMEMLDEVEQIKYEHSGEVTLDNLFGLRKRIIDRVNEVERESKEKNARRNG